MLTLHVLVLAATLSAADDTVLLEFSADWCENCRTMAPTMQRLTSGGFPVRRVNIDREPALAQQFRVEGVPTYVMLAGGRPVDRITGATSYDRLLRMYQAAQPQANAPGTPQVRGQSPAETAAPLSAVAFEAASAPGGAPAAGSATERALAASVRLKIEDGQGNSFGTGTVVDVRGDEALVLTCGHIFRDSKGQGKITADFFGPGARAGVEGHLIGYDLTRDIGLVSLRPGFPVAAMPVAPAGARFQKGDAVFTVGCDKGGDPSVRTSFISAVNKYLGPPNVEVKGMPVDGRSGGGLFSSAGYLIGVCNAADRADDEGLYAALPTVHAELDRTNLSFVYRGAAPVEKIAAPAPATPALAASAAPPAMPERMPKSAANTAGLANEGSAAALAAAPLGLPAGAEVICIVRSNDPRENSRVIVLPQPSSDFLERLAREHQHQQVAELTSLRTSAGASPIPGGALTQGEGRPATPILRGQSPQR